MKEKPFWKSKLFYAGAVEIALGCVDLYDKTPHDWRTAVIFAAGIITIILRIFTGTRIRLGG